MAVSMITIPAPTKTAPVIITLTIATTAPENPSVGDLLKIVTVAKSIASENAKHGTVTGTLSIGKQKYKLEDEVKP
jgi:hypothetical protein